MSKCLLCTETRGLQKCHLIPRYLTKHIYWIVNNYVIILCPNHHWYLDHDQLRKEEATIMHPLIIGAMADLIEVHRVIKPKNITDITHKINTKSIKAKIYAWVKKKAEIHNV